MKRNSHNHFRKKRMKSIKSIENNNIVYEKDKYKNKLDKLLKEKSAIEKEISNLSNSYYKSNILNQSNKNNKFLKLSSPKSVKKRSFDKNNIM